jgi:hypothetical protein
MRSVDTDWKFRSGFEIRIWIRNPDLDSESESRSGFGIRIQKGKHYPRKIEKNRAVNPDSLNPDLDPAFQVNIDPDTDLGL